MTRSRAKEIPGVSVLETEGIVSSDNKTTLIEAITFFLEPISCVLSVRHLSVQAVAELETD